MGAQESKSNCPNTPETPHFASYAKMFNLTEDPRSPAAAQSRTPILVQNTLWDPRSPSHADDDINRTPIFSIPEPVSPFVRYKMENPAYVDSPLSRVGSTAEENTECLSAAIEDDFEHITIADNDEPNNATESDGKVLDQNLEKACSHPKIKKRQRRAGTKNKQSLLKTALFKPYIDQENLIENEQLEITPKKASKEKIEKSSKRTPLVSRNFVLFTNENALSAQKIESGSKKVPHDLFTAKKKLKELSIACDKENVQF